MAYPAVADLRKSTAPFEGYVSARMLKARRANGPLRRTTFLGKTQNRALYRNRRIPFNEPIPIANKDPNRIDYAHRAAGVLRYAGQLVDHKEDDTCQPVWVRVKSRGKADKNGDVPWIAKMKWTKPVNTRDNIIKRGVISRTLGDGLIHGGYDINDKTHFSMKIGRNYKPIGPNKLMVDAEGQVHYGRKKKYTKKNLNTESGKWTDRINEFIADRDFAFSERGDDDDNHDDYGSSDDEHKYSDNEHEIQGNAVDFELPDAPTHKKRRADRPDPSKIILTKRKRAAPNRFEESFPRTNKFNKSRKGRGDEFCCDT